jgi:hypothetical protein
MTEIMRALRLLIDPDTVAELRAIGTARGVDSGYYNDLEALANTAARLSGQAEGVYVTLNPVHEALLSRSRPNHSVQGARTTTADTEIVRRSRLLIDLDPLRPRGISSSDAEHAAAIKRAHILRDSLDGRGWPAPLFADSGNGAHLVYAIDLPNDDDARMLVKRCLEALAFLVDTERVIVDPGMFNAARISKVYGTLAAKGADTADRPHRLARILEAPERLELVPRELLAAFAEMAPPTASPPPGKRGCYTLDDIKSALAVRWLVIRKEKPWRDATLLELAQCPWQGDAHPRTARVILFPSGGVSAGCFHASCAGRGWRELRDVLGISASPTANPSPGAVVSDGLDLVPLRAMLGESDSAPGWLVEGRLPAAGLGLLAGKPKAGKSTLARGLVLAVARGAPWLGQTTTQGPVIYLALEEKRQEIREHFRAMGASEEPIHVLCAAAPDDALDRLRVEAERLRPVLIVIDPMFRFVRVRDCNDYVSVTTALEPVMTLARETGAHVLLVHHLGKGGREDGDAILGSTAIFGAVDCALLMKRTEKYRTLSTIQRYGADLGEITLALDPVTRDVTAGPPRVQADEQDAGERIISYLATVQAPVTEADILHAIQCRAQVGKRALRTLVAGNQIIRTGAGVKGHPFQYSGSQVDIGNQGTGTPFPALTSPAPSKNPGSPGPSGVLVPSVPPKPQSEPQSGSFWGVL